jgi:uncharacterized protein (DUF2336 family)
MTEVRQASYERLLQLAHQRAIDGKGGLAASVAKLCLDTRADLSVQELALVFDILRKLIDQVEVSVRRYISDFLSERADVPKDLITFLANDSIHVAYPVLIHSVLLDEDDLLQIIDRQGRSHHLAIAKRAGIGERVTERLAATRDADVIVEAVRNFSARFRRATLEELVDRSFDDTALQEPLAHRADLPTALARRLYIWVGDALKMHLAANQAIDQHSLDEMVDRAVEDAFSLEPSLAYNPDPALPERRPRPMLGWSDQEPLLAALERGGAKSLAEAYARRTGIGLAVAQTLFDTRAPETVAIACKAIDLDEETFTAVLLGLMEPAQAESFRASGRLAKVVAYFDRIDLDGAASVLQRWRGQGMGAVRRIDRDS